MRVREQMGGYAQSPREYPPPKDNRTEKQKRLLIAYAELKHTLILALDRFIGCDRTTYHRDVPCKGVTPVLKDDHDAFGSWGRVVRLVEDHR